MSDFPTFYSLLATRYSLSMFFGKTYFSFHYGTYGTEELVKVAGEHGVSSLALTNINNTCDAWDFVDFCRQQNIKPILGVEIRNAHKFLYILLAKNNKGFLEINRYLSEHLQAKKEFPEVDFSKSVMVGNTIGDMEFGRNLGIPINIFIRSTHPLLGVQNPMVDLVYPDLSSFARAL